MSDYQGISGTIFDEPEYESPVELVVMIYLMITRDMAGVCPIHPQVSAAKCRTSITKFKKAIKDFEQKDKLIINEKRTHIWLKAGIWHSLYKGKCSDTQAKSVGGSLRKWQTSEAFGKNFAEAVLQHYTTKYNYVIPYPYPTHALGSALINSNLNPNLNPNLNTQTQAQTGEIADAYFKKFGKRLEKEEQESLLKKYSDEQLLLMMIRHITINNKIENPTGLLITARNSYRTHIPDNKYSAWEELILRIASRKS